MSNLSQQKRMEMLNYLEQLKAIHTDDESQIALLKIQTALTEKKYGLVWEEHEEEVNKMLLHNIPVFIENSEKKVVANENEPFNFLLEGDNLHSLKLLEKTHSEKIDVIYIDPPYNTGEKDFIYNDAFVDKTDGFAHSKWISFMNKRLLFAKELMNKSSVIFISINNIELAQLKMLSDEIFGEQNFIGNLTWESTTQPINAGSARFQLQQKIEYILCYAKDKNHTNTFILKEEDGKLSYPHTGNFGACRFEIIEKSDSGRYKRESMKFQILGQFPREGKRWQIGEKTARQLEKEGKVQIIDGIVKKAVYPEDELDKKKFIPFWSHYTAKDVGTAQSGKDNLNEILGRQSGFDTVKPLVLIKELLSHFHPSIPRIIFRH